MEFLFDRTEKPSPAWAKVATACGLFALYSALCFWIFSSSVRDWEKVWGYRAVFFNGWMTTIGISAVALVLSTVFGVSAALARRSAFLPLKYTAVLYVETIRGLPLMFLVLFGFYGVADKLGWNDRLPVGVLILSRSSGPGSRASAGRSGIRRARSGSRRRRPTGW